MTYYKHIPDSVYLKYKNTNPDYNIDFSLDNDCISFLQTYFNNDLAELFKNIRHGMFKADLWRLCKLYINGGIYTDVDLVPYIDFNSLDNDISFYSCLTADKNSIFQAFMKISHAKSPLILNFIISFLLNKPYTYWNGPTFDMLNCIKYNLNNIEINSEQKYQINQVKIYVNIGSSLTNTKKINLFYFPNDVSYTIELNNNIYNDTFDFVINNNYLIARRLDTETGWGFNHSVNICINTCESIFLFPEHYYADWSKCYVSRNNIKIFDSRDYDYFINKGW